MRKKLLSLALAITMLSSLSFAACGESNDADKKTDGKSYTDVVGGGTGTGKTTTDLDLVFEDTSVVLAQNGATEYSIVISASASWEVQQGANELALFFKEATGAMLPTLKDTGLRFDQTKKYISLGETTVSADCGLELSYEEYNEDGFHIKTFGNTVVIDGAENAGAMYGVYEFLWYNLGVRLYANDEFKIPDLSKSTVYLKNFDYASVPDFHNRSLGLSYKKYPEINEYRLGLNKNNGKNWIAWCHTSFQLLPKATYQAEHPDWYSADGSQLCYTNEGMIEEMIKVLKGKVEKAGKYGLIEIGIEDVSTFCTCEKCTEEAALYGGNSGVMMRFINKIADEMNPWVESTFNGEKVMKWIIFAYGRTTDAPVKQNADGSYSPVHESVVAHENVGVMLAPLGADWAHSMVDEDYNARYKRFCEGWRAVKPEFYIYSYNVVYDNQLLFMDSWSYVKEQYQIWIDMGAEFIFDQSASHINLPFFEMTSYVRSRLMWDTDADVEYYMQDFIDNYYKAGAEYVKKYLDLVRTRYKLVAAEMEKNGEPFHQWSYVRYDPDIESEQYWPKDWCLNGVKLFEEAIEHIEKTMEEGEEKEKAICRVKAEMLSPIYLLLKIYATEMTGADITYYCNLFRDAADANSITYWHEHAASQGDTIQKLINGWMANVK